MTSATFVVIWLTMSIVSFALTRAVCRNYVRFHQSDSAMANSYRIIFESVYGTIAILAVCVATWVVLIPVALLAWFDRGHDSDA
jgi:hypothetical protein